MEHAHHKTYYLPIVRYKEGEYVPESALDRSENFHQIVQDVWDGQIENVSRLWRIDTWYGHFYDETERLAKALGEESLHRSKRPYRALRAWLDNRSVEYYEGEEQ